MEFSEMKMVWDSQNQEPLYAMNEGALQAIVQRKNQESERCLSRCFATEITIGMICGALMFLCAVALLVSGPALLAALPRMKAAASLWDILALMTAGWNLVLLLRLYVSGAEAAAAARGDIRFLTPG